MSLEKIGNLFDKFRKLTPPDMSVRKAASLIIKSSLNLEVPVRKVSFNKKNGLIFLEIDNLKKAVIFLQKKEVISKINDSLGKDIVKEIR